MIVSEPHGLSVHTLKTLPQVTTGESVADTLGLSLSTMYKYLISELLNKSVDIITNIIIIMHIIPTV